MMELSPLLVFFMILNSIIAILFFIFTKHTAKQNEKILFATRQNDKMALELIQWIINNPNMDIKKSVDAQTLIIRRIETYKNLQSVLKKIEDKESIEQLLIFESLVA